MPIPDTIPTPREQRDDQRALAKAATRAENERRAAQPAADLSDLVQRAGDNLRLAVPLIRAHAGIAARCASAGIEVDSLVSALLHLAIADSSRAGCTTSSWCNVAERCAEWGLIPTLSGDTPVYVFCRDRQQGKLTVERTRWGYAAQLARVLTDAHLSAGWTFSAEAQLGALAQRVREGRPGAREAADQIRAALTARAGGLDADQRAILAALVCWLDRDAQIPPELRPAVIRLGKATEDADLRAALRWMVRPSDPIPDEQRPALRARLADLREDLESATSGLDAQESALLAGLSLPDWSDHRWYTATGPAEERLIEWAPPSLALWSRPEMAPARIDGVPVVWWARLTYTEGAERREIGMELSRDAVYERAVAGKSVRISPAGLLIPASEKQSPWMDWHGEMGAVKAIRELLKAHPTLLSRIGVEVHDGDEIDREEPAPLVGVEHLRRVRQIAEGGPSIDLEPVAERVAVEVRS